MTIRYSRSPLITNAFPEVIEVESFDQFERDVFAYRGEVKGQHHVFGPMKANGQGRPHRSSECALPRRWLPFDLDYIADRDTFKALRVWFKQVRHFGYETASSTEESPRARVVVELDRACDRDECLKIGAVVEAGLHKVFGDKLKLDKRVYQTEQAIYCPLVGAPTFSGGRKPVSADKMLERAGAAGEKPREERKPREGKAPGAGDDLVIQRLKKMGLYLRDLGAGKHALICPWDREHSSADPDASTATVYYQPHHGGFMSAGFKCFHTHCLERRGGDLLDFLGLDAAAEVRAREREESRRIGEGPLGDEDFRPEDCLPPRLTLDQMLYQYVFLSDGKRVVQRENPAVSLAFDEFVAATAASVELVASGNSVRALPIAKKWLSDPRRLTAHTATFRPGAGEFTRDPAGKPALNLWKPVPLAPTPENYVEVAQPFFDHLDYLIPEARLAELFKDYLAHIEQKPGEKANYGWLHITDEVQGIGRNWITAVLARVWAGYTALDFNLLGMVKDGFTGRLSRKLLVVVNEIMAAQVRDRHEFGERIKNLITDEIIEINPKFGRRHVEYLLARLVIFSNHLAAMPLADHDRRFVVVQNPSVPREAAYYVKLYALLRNPEFIASVRRVLAERDIRAFDAGARAPASEAKTRVVAATRNALDSALLEIRESWPGDLIKAQAVVSLVRHLMGSRDDKDKLSGLQYAYGRCGFVSLNKNVRLDGKAGRVIAIRNAEAWNAQQAADPGAVAKEVERIESTLPQKTWSLDNVVSGGLDYGASFDALQTEVTP